MTQPNGTNPPNDNSKGRGKKNSNAEPAVRLPPQNLQAEMATLGSQILWSKKIDPVSSIIKPSDYYSDVHGLIQTALNSLHKDGTPVDPVTVSSRLDQMGKLTEIGGVAKIVELMESVPDGAHAEHYADIVASCSRRRQAIAIGKALIESAYSTIESESELIESAINASTRLTDLMTGVDKAKPLYLVDEAVNVLEGYSRGETPSVYWGIPELDRMTGGMAPGELIVVGARPSQGKTLLGMQTVSHVSLHHPCLFCSEEMLPRLLASRSILSLSSLPEHEWKSNIPQLMTEVSEYFNQRKPILVTPRLGHIAEIERAITRCVQTHGIKFVVVDYAGMIDADGFNLTEKVSDVTKRLKRVAQKHDLIVMLLAQLNRKIESRERGDNIPKMSDLKDSGSLEQEADVILAPFWPWMQDKSYDRPKEYRVYHLKNRNRGIHEQVIEFEIDKLKQWLKPPSDQLGFD